MKYVSPDDRTTRSHLAELSRRAAAASEEIPFPPSPAAAPAAAPDAPSDAGASILAASPAASSLAAAPPDR
eukprot:scaffold1044_cov120-Isochrysis_galbana.AAC.21